jgi:hypothetical protein
MIIYKARRNRHACACRPAGRENSLWHFADATGLRDSSSEAGQFASGSRPPLKDQLQSVDLLADMTKPERAHEGQGGRIESSQPRAIHTRSIAASADGVAKS